MGVLNFSLMGAGIASSGGLGVGDGPSIGGQRPRHNNFTIEGVDNNRKDVTGRNVSVPSEAVAQVTVLQNQFSAEFGHSSGGQFNVILKGGTNSFHGSVYEYLQNRKLNAVDASLARAGERSNPRYDSNLIGGSVGGPVLRNRLFYFADLEYNPIGRATAGSTATLAPTAEGHRQLAAISGLSATNLNVLQQYLGAAPAASGSTNVRGVSIPIGGLFLATPSYQNTQNWLASVDYALSEGTRRVRGTSITGRQDSTRKLRPIFRPSINFGIRGRCSGRYRNSTASPPA